MRQEAAAPNDRHGYSHLAAEESVRLLKAAAPGLPVIHDVNRGEGIGARAELVRARSVKFAYLAAAGTHAVLDLYPADTLTQARALYSRPDHIAGLLSLREHGWDLRPLFHFGFVERGFVNTRSRLDAGEYAAYWASRIGTLAAFGRADWEHELHVLIEDGVFDPADMSEFERSFTHTHRTSAVPRPGFHLSRKWDLAQARTVDFPVTLGAVLRRALIALGEQAAAEALAPAPGTSVT